MTMAVIDMRGKYDADFSTGVDEKTCFRMIINSVKRAT